MPSAKIRIATIASIRKKPPSRRRARRCQVRHARLSPASGGGIARGDLAARRHRDAPAADLAAALDAGAGSRIRNVDRVRRAVGRAAEAVERNPAVEDGGSRGRAGDLDRRRGRGRRRLPRRPSPRPRRTGPPDAAADEPVPAVDVGAGDVGEVRRVDRPCRSGRTRSARCAGSPRCAPSAGRCSSSRRRWRAWSSAGRCPSPARRAPSKTARSAMPTSSSTIVKPR